MGTIEYDSDQAREIEAFIKEDFKPSFGRKPNSSRPDPRWSKLRRLGTDLWLDTGDPDQIGKLWNTDFSALTTNNTLLNKEIQKGAYDRSIPRAGSMLNSKARLKTEELQLELAFILNARHALSLVEDFDAYEISVGIIVENHTGFILIALWH